MSPEVAAETAREIAVVGVTFRQAPTVVRAQAVAIDSQEQAPSKQLLNSGFAAGVVRIETCSRSEWVISSYDARWAGELLRSSLTSRLGLPVERKDHTFHLRVGLGAVHYLFRLASGLDSLAEGEAAVGRQVLKAFATAHENKQTDRTLNLAWNHLGKLIHHKRRLVEARPGVGVQKLLLDEMKERGVLPNDTILLIGLGQIGHSVLSLLQQNGLTKIATFGRATLPGFSQQAKTARVIIAASGSPQAWLTLPERHDHPLVFDLGSPQQLVSHSGWTSVGLDQLLSRPGCFLEEDDLERLLALVEAQSAGLLSAIKSSASSGSLGSIEQQRSEFVHQLLPKLLASIEQPTIARELRREIQAFTHGLLETAAARGPGVKR